MRAHAGPGLPESHLRTYIHHHESIPEIIIGSQAIQFLKEIHPWRSLYFQLGVESDILRAIIRANTI